MYLIYINDRAVTKEIVARRKIRYLDLHERTSGLCARERLRIGPVACYYSYCCLKFEQMVKDS